MEKLKQIQPEQFLKLPTLVQLDYRAAILTWLKSFIIKHYCMGDNLVDCIVKYTYFSFSNVVILSFPDEMKWNKIKFNHNGIIVYFE